MPTEVFTVYGPLGLLALCAGLAAVHVWRRLNHERDRHAKEKEEARVSHLAETQRLQAQFEALQERHFSAAVKQVEQYHNLAQSMHKVLESLERRLSDRR